MVTQRSSIAVLVSVILPLWSGTARAQNLADLIPNLLGSTTVINARSATGVDHTAHFVPDLTQRVEAPAQINDAIVSQLTTFPLGTSSGGFTYTFDPALNTFNRRSESFGPLFAERALTVGRNRASFGMNYQHSSYDRMAGMDLHGSELKFIVRHNDCCPAGAAGTTPLEPPFEGDVIEAALSLDLKTDIVSFFGSYGVTDNLDIGVVVPIVSVDMAASVSLNLLRLATTGLTPPPHSFNDAGSTTRVLQDEGSASGLGDMIVRAKYNFLKRGDGGLAAAVDLRLPTGEVEQLLGTGSTQAKFFVIGSTGMGALSPHFNFGFTASSEGVKHQRDEVNFATGIDFTATQRLTVAADVIGRTLRNAGRFTTVTDIVQFRTVAAGPLQNSSLSRIDLEAGSLHLLLGAAGLKYNPTGNLLITVNALFPLTNAGLQDRFTPVVGIDYAF